MNSIIIPAYNEGRYIESSLRSIMASLLEPENVEILLLDDASTDDTFEAASRVAGVRTVHSAQRRGVAYLRRLGTAMSRGETVTYLDAHDWFNGKGALDLLFREAIENRTAIIGAANIIADVQPSKCGGDWEGAVQRAMAGKCPVNRGHGLSFAAHRNWFYLSVERHLYHPLTRRTACQANGLTMSRELAEYMHDWWALPGMWSGNDVGMAVKAWFMDVPVLAECRAEVIHAQKPSSSHETPGWQQTLNKAYVAWCCFDDELFNGFWKPNFTKALGWDPRLDEALATDAAREEREWFRTVRRMDQNDFMKLFVYPRMRGAA